MAMEAGNPPLTRLLTTVGLVSTAISVAEKQFRKPLSHPLKTVAGFRAEDYHVFGAVQPCFRRASP